MKSRHINIVSPKEKMIEPLKKSKDEEIEVSFLSGTRIKRKTLRP